MRHLQFYVNSLPVSDGLKRELLSADSLHQHRLYVDLPSKLQPLFPSVSSAALIELNGAVYLYYRWLLHADRLLDEPGGGGYAHTLRTLEYMALYEAAVRSLNGLFPGGDPFWAALAEGKQACAVANLRAAELSDGRDPAAFTKSEYERLAADKSAVCYAVVHAMASLGHDAAPVPAAVQCLTALHVGAQYHDDVHDYPADRASGRFGYAQALVEARTEAARPGGSSRDARWWRSRLYTSGVAAEMLAAARHHFSQARLAAGTLGLRVLSAEIDAYLTSNRTFARQLDTLLRQATSLAAAA